MSLNNKENLQGKGLLSFSEPARKTMRRAEDIAKEHRHGYIGSEHILLALIADPTNIASQLIATKIKTEDVKYAIEFVIGTGERIPTGEIDLTQRSKKIIELAINEARINSDIYIGTKHLLLGIIREGEGVAAGVLGSYGIDEKDLPALRENAKELSTQFPAENSIEISPEEQQKTIDETLAEVKSVFEDKDITPEVKNRVLISIELITKLAKNTKEKQNLQK